MSGGSYNYLCSADASDIGNRLSDLNDMADRLEGINPDGHAAADTLEVRAILGALEYALRRLSPVWQAVEWRDSNDWSEAQMVAAINEYEAMRREEEHECRGFHTAVSGCTLPG